MKVSPDVDALRFKGHRLTYSELDAVVRDSAARLLASPAPSHESGQVRVGLLLDRSPEYVVCYLACARLGWLIIPLDGTNHRDLDTNLRLTRPEVLLCRPDSRELLTACRVRPSQVRVVRLAGGIVQGLCDPLPANAVREPRQRLCGDTPLVLIATSGSTSRPKRAQMTHRNIAQNALDHLDSLGMHPGARAGSVMLVALSPIFGYCNTAQIVAQLAAGGTLVLLDVPFSPRAVAELIERHGVTSTTLVPSMLRPLSRFAHWKRYDTSSLQMILFGGAPADPDCLAILRRVLPDTELVETYGQTEAGPRITTLRGHERDEHPGSVGRAIRNVSIRIESDAGSACAPGESGEVLIRGAGVMTGYFEDPDLTRDVLRDGWLHTGDLGYLDGAGYLTLTGRRRNLIIVGGKNVQAEEVEHHLLGHPQVKEAAVFGTQDDIRGEHIVALVVPQTANFDAQEVLVALRQSLPAHKVPRQIVLTQKLPRTSNGKIDRLRLSHSWTGGESPNHD